MLSYLATGRKEYTMKVDYVLITENIEGLIKYYVFYQNDSYKSYEDIYDIPKHVWDFLDNFPEPTDTLYLEDNLVWQIQGYGKHFNHIC